MVFCRVARVVVVVSSFLVTASAFAAEQPSNASGSVTVNGYATALHYAVPTPSSGRNFWYEPYRLTGAWIGGRSRTKQQETFFKTVWDYNVTFLTTVGAKGFDVPTASALADAHKANDAREAARIVPAGGGEEGAIYLSYRHNLESKDGKALLDQMTASMKSAIAADMHASAPLSESAAGSWAFMQSMPPGIVEVVGGVRDADGTTLELTKSETAGGRKTFGTARLVKDHGAWKVAEESWR